MSYALLAKGKRATAESTRCRLRIGGVDDAADREADRMADEVTRGGTIDSRWSFARIGIAPGLQRKCSCGGSGDAECKCEEHKEHNEVRRKAVSRSSGPALNKHASPIVRDVLRSSGHRLDNSTRHFFEQRFNHDFASVRLHFDSQASKSARSIGPLAYTAGNHIVFQTNAYAPRTTDGLRLVAHELAHVIQQPAVIRRKRLQRKEPRPVQTTRSDSLALQKRNGKPTSKPQNNLRGNLFLGPARDTYEAEAARAADLVARTLSMQSPPSVSIALIEKADSSTDSDSEPSKSVVQTSGTRDGLESLPPQIESRINSLRLRGQSLKSSTRSLMEARFGHDFSQVRIHSGQEAAALAASLNTKAFTVGRDIFIGNRALEWGKTSGFHLLAHELAHVVQQSGSARGEAKTRTRQVVRRYGQAKSCTDADHLKPFIWPGHDHATKITGRALEELLKDPLHPTVKNQLEQFFGKDSTTASNVKAIREKFQRIQSALGEQYLYHCANPCESPNKGFNAWTSHSGNKDITICFDQVKGFSAQAAGWIIVHENVHRGLNVWPEPHPWRPTDFAACVSGLGAGSVAQQSLVLDNPDSYACFASRMWNPL